MLKRIGIVFTVYLLVIAGGRISTAITLENPGISKFVLNDYGIVTEAYWLGEPTLINFLDSDATRGLNFGVYSPDLRDPTTNAAINTIWLNEIITSGPVYDPVGDLYEFSGTAPFKTASGANISLAFRVKAKLQAGKPYIDLRYDVQISTYTGPVVKVAFYFLKEPRDGHSLLASNETAGASKWQMVNDTSSIWGFANWPSSQRIFTSGGVLGLTVKKGDDAKGGEYSDVWDKVNNGQTFPGIDPSPGISVTPSNPAWGLRYPASTPFTVTYYQLPSGDMKTMEARLEVTPEPSTICLMLTGLFGIAGMARRRFLK
jgi:hypothetical protein